MKITRRQLKRIIGEEMNRPRPIELYSDEELMREGLISWLKDLFGKFKDEFNKRATSSAKKTTMGLSKISGKGGAVDLEMVAAAKKYGVEGIKSVDDLDMKDKTHQKIYWTAIAPTSLDFIARDMKKLQTLAGVKDWTPKSDSSEDLKAWEKAEGDKEIEIWNLHGGLAGILSFLGKKGISSAQEAAGIGHETVSRVSHASSVKWMVDATKVLEGLWDSAATMEVEGASKVASGYVKLRAGITDLGKAIVASAKEQQREWVDVRRMVNAVILSEGTPPPWMIDAIRKREEEEERRQEQGRRLPLYAPPPPEQQEEEEEEEDPRGSAIIDYRLEGRRVRVTKKQLRRIIAEELALDLEVGDVILTGRFKNKRTVVKKLGTDDLGQPTVNGMKVLSFRIEKLMPKSKWSKKTLAELEEDEE